MTFEVVAAPSRADLVGQFAVFLRGTTTASGSADWRSTLASRLRDSFDDATQGISILNPARDDWDSSWRKDFSDPRWAEQFAWEQDMLERADLVVVLLHGVTAAPVSLLELGLVARWGNAVVCVLDGYPKAGYVEALCVRLQLRLTRSEEALAARVVLELSRALAASG